jgi:glycolate oxidase iron-sulfur subunit
MKLHLDEDELAACVACGLCLPHCPTFRVTGDESRSPRGRIAAMRLVDAGREEPTTTFTEVIDTCVQCRACEPACPSGVPFGALMEGTRTTLARETSYLPRRRRWLLRLLGRPRLLRAGATVLAVGQRLRIVPSRRLGLPPLPVRRAPHRTSGDEVVLFTGCVMDVVQRPVHAAAQRVIEATGAGVRPSGDRAPCCGALAAHAGDHDEAVRRAEQVIAVLPGSGDIVVDAAGCGAQMKEYGRLLGTARAEAFSARVQDVSEWLADRIDRLPPAVGAVETVAIQDPCHLRHVQRCHEAVRRVLAGRAAVVELDDEGMCCGAGGAYAFTQPELARAIRDRKLEAIARADAPVVVSANPGCALHLAAAGVTVRHPVEVVDRSLPEGAPHGG